MCCKVLHENSLLSPEQGNLVLVSALEKVTSEQKRIYTCTLSIPGGPRCIAGNQIVSAPNSTLCTFMCRFGTWVAFDPAASSQLLASMLSMQGQDCCRPCPSIVSVQKARLGCPRRRAFFDRDFWVSPKNSPKTCFLATNPHTKVGSQHTYDMSTIHLADNQATMQPATSRKRFEHPASSDSGASPLKRHKVVTHLETASQYNQGTAHLHLSETFGMKLFFGFRYKWS
jgi:hypothetical protein